MANKKTETKIEKKETKTEETKDTKKPSKPSKVDVKKAKKKLETEIRKVQDDIFVEITNISHMNCTYYNRLKRSYFDLYPNEVTELTLGELSEVVSKSKGYFTNYSIIISDVLDEEYSIDTILEYLGLNLIYKDIEDATDDFLEDILEFSDDEFENIINSKNKNFAKTVTCKAIYLTKSESNDFELSRKKENILCDALGKERNSLINE